jgi:glycosyltransferase involved in cell wall biosynthesis
MFKSYTIAIIVPVFNNVDELSRTVDSVLKQTYPMAELRLLFIDNFSTDGSYERILDYISEYPALFSVERLNEPTKPARLLKHASEYLRFYLPDMYAFMYPGDLLYPCFFERCVKFMHLLPEVRVVYANADIAGTGEDFERQRPIFTENCIFDKNADCGLFFKCGIGSRVFALFHRDITENKRLVEWEKRRFFNDWLSLAYPDRGKAAYFTESLGLIKNKGNADVLFDLMTKLQSLKSQFFSTESESVNIESSERDSDDMLAAYRCVAKNALIEAASAGAEAKTGLVDDLLIFAEIAYLPIAQDPWYEDIKRAGTPAEYIELSAKMKNISVKPPRHCKIF